MTAQKHGKAYRGSRKDTEALFFSKDPCLPEHLTVRGVASPPLGLLDGVERQISVVRMPVDERFVYSRFPHRSRIQVLAMVEPFQEGLNDGIHTVG